MVILEGRADRPIIVALDDDSEIEITIVELEGNKSQVIVCAHEAISVVHKYLNSPN